MKRSQRRRDYFKKLPSSSIVLRASGKKGTRGGLKSVISPSLTSSASSPPPSPWLSPSVVVAEAASEAVACDDLEDILGCDVVFEGSQVSQLPSSYMVVYTQQEFLTALDGMEAVNTATATTAKANNNVPFYSNIDTASNGNSKSIAISLQEACMLEQKTLYPARYFQSMMNTNSSSQIDVLLASLHNATNATAISNSSVISPYQQTLLDISREVLVLSSNEKRYSIVPTTFQLPYTSTSRNICGIYNIEE